MLLKFAYQDFIGVKSLEIQSRLRFKITKHCLVDLLVTGLIMELEIVKK